MASLRDSPLRRGLLITVVLLFVACDRQAQPAGQDEAGAAGADTAGALDRADPELTAVCDTVGSLLRTSISVEPEVTYGGFTGSVRGTQRYGCRFAAQDTLPPDVPRPLDRVWEGLASRGWSMEAAYSAEGPEGRLAGMRRESIVCVLQHYWDVGSDDDRAEQWVQPARYDAVIECFREAQRTPAD